MAHIKQALKRHRQSLIRRDANRARISEMKTEIKKTEAQIAAGDAAKSREALSAAMQQIDKAAKRGAIHKNTASRRKSSLSRKLKELEAKGSTGKK